MAVKTGILKVSELYDNHILECINSTSVSEEIVYRLKAALGFKLSDLFYTDHREFVVRTAEMQRIKGEFTTTFTLSGLVLLRHEQDCEIGEHAQAEKHTWERQYWGGGYWYVREFPALSVSLEPFDEQDLPTTLTIAEKRFKPVKFGINQEVMYAWERVS